MTNNNHRDLFLQYTIKVILTICLLILYVAEATAAFTTIAVDSSKYEAWPHITKDSKGRLYVVYRTSDSNTHSFDPTGRIVLRKSIDGGETWGEEIIVADEIGVDDRNPSIMIFNENGNERILIAYNTNDGRLSLPYVITSVIPGLQWRTRIRLSNSEGRTRGRPILLSNGKILVPWYSWPEHHNCFVSESSVGDTTWTTYPVQDGIGDELSLIEVKTNGKYEGRIYGLIRDQYISPNSFQKVISTDYGRTWGEIEEEIQLPTSQGGPCDLVRLSNRHILAIYHSPGDEVLIYESLDECDTWVRITNIARGRGYPSVVEISSTHHLVVSCTNTSASDVFGHFYDYPGGPSLPVTPWVLLLFCSVIVVIFWLLFVIFRARRPLW